MTTAARELIVDNPFYVLGVAPDCTRAEMEREGHKLLAMIELRLSSVRYYATPIGMGERTAEKVREAMAQLRDPEHRLRHEMWAQLPTDELLSAASPNDDDDDDELPVWPDALKALGYQR